MSVNTELIEVCISEGPYTSAYPCNAGPAELSGTGYDIWGGYGYPSAAATRWLTSSAPIQPGEELTIRFAIWDAGDADGDAAVLLDNFRWLTATPPLVTQP